MGVTARPRGKAVPPLIMHISVYAHDANPEVDRRLFRKSRDYCRREVEAGRAEWISGSNAIQLRHPSRRAKADPKEKVNVNSHGPISAQECRLICESRGWWEQLTADERAARIAYLASKCEAQIEQAMADRRPPIGAAVRRMTANAKLLAYPFGDTKAPRIAVGLCQA